MALANENYLKLKAGYLFPEIGRRERVPLRVERRDEPVERGRGDERLVPLHVDDDRESSVHLEKGLGDPVRSRRMIPRCHHGFGAELPVIIVLAILVSTPFQAGFLRGGRRSRSPMPSRQS